jgi:cell division protein FtsW
MTAAARRSPSRAPSRTASHSSRAELRAVPAVGAGTSEAILWVVVLALNLIGLAMVLSASSAFAVRSGGSAWDYGMRQGAFTAVGMVALGVFRRVDYHRLQRLVPAALAVTIASLVAVLAPGVGRLAGGARRWIPLGPVAYQPAELAKLALVLYVAHLLATRRRKLHDPLQVVLPTFVVMGAFGVLLILQPDLGSIAVLLAVAVAMLYSAGANQRWTAYGFAGLAGIGALLAVFEPYRRRRLLAFLDPWADPLGNGWQTINSMVGIANGGLMGVGIGEGSAKWGYVPEAHTDFIFSVIAEEMGFAGAALVVVLFVAVALVGCRIALHAPDAFGRLLVTGITVWLVFQAFVNMGVVVGLLPIKGLPLPFVSYGGTSMVMCMAGVGVMLNVCRQARA